MHTQAHEKIDTHTRKKCRHKLCPNTAASDGSGCCLIHGGESPAAPDSTYEACLVAYIQACLSYHDALFPQQSRFAAKKVENLHPTAEERAEQFFAETIVPHVAGATSLSPTNRQTYPVLLENISLPRALKLTKTLPARYFHFRNCDLAGMPIGWFLPEGDHFTFLFEECHFRRSAHFQEADGPELSFLNCHFDDHLLIEDCADFHAKDCRFDGPVKVKSSGNIVIEECRFNDVLEAFFESSLSESADPTDRAENPIGLFHSSVFKQGFFLRVEQIRDLQINHCHFGGAFLAIPAGQALYEKIAITHSSFEGDFMAQFLNIYSCTVAHNYFAKQMNFDATEFWGRAHHFHPEENPHQFCHNRFLGEVLFHRADIMRKLYLHQNEYHLETDVIEGLQMIEDRQTRQTAKHGLPSRLLRKLEDFIISDQVMN